MRFQPKTLNSVCTFCLYAHLTLTPPAFLCITILAKETWLQEIEFFEVEVVPKPYQENVICGEKGTN